jgi:hypothetical protein
MSVPRLPGYLGQLQDRVTTATEQPAQSLPAKVSGGLGVVPAAPIDTAKELPEPRRLSAAQAERLMTAELLSAVRSLVMSSTEIADRLGRRGATNGVLDVFLEPAGVGGYITRSYPVTIGCVGIINHSEDAAAVVHSGPPGPAAPSRGTGVQQIEPGSFLVVPIADRSFTCWAAAETKLSVQVFTGLQPWGAGVL